MDKKLRMFRIFLTFSALACAGQINLLLPLQQALHFFRKHARQITYESRSLLTHLFRSATKNSKCQKIDSNSQISTNTTLFTITEREKAAQT